MAQPFDYEAHPENFQFLNALANYSRLYNRIYMPIGVAEGMRHFVTETILELDDAVLEQWQNPGIMELIESPQPTAIFILYDPRNLESFAVAAAAFLPDFWKTGDVSAAFDWVIGSMDMMLQLADAIKWATIIASALVLALLIILFLRERRHEMGIYMALGEKKSRVMAQILIEIGLVAIVGMTLSLFAGRILSDTISRQMLEQHLTEQLQESGNTAEVIPWELTLFNPGVISIEETLEMYDVSLSMNTVITVVSTGTFVILASTIIPIWYIVKLEPKEILM